MSTVSTSKARASASTASSRDRVPFSTTDLSQFARGLATELAKTAAPPSHLSLLNMIARAAGHANYQTLRARSTTQALKAVESTASTVAASALSDHARKALGHFDTQGRLLRWPTKFAVQRVTLWGLWMQITAKRTYTEREITDLLSQLNGFNDPVTLRRELINMKMMSRKADCSAYWKEPVRAPEDAIAFMQALRAQSAA
jgi:hypothetical protein